jgi:hypothetical protein
MITGYQEFILERHIMSLNESVVKYSDRFADLLGMVDSPISKALLSVRDEDKPVKTNYFDLAADGDHMSFLMDARAQQLSQRSNLVEVTQVDPVFSYYYRDLLNKIGFDRSNFVVPQQGQVARVVSETTWNGKDYVRLAYEDRDDGPGCVTHKSNVKPSDAVYWGKGRQDIRVGRGVRALVGSLGMQFSDAEIEDFVNKFKANFAIANDAFRRFEVVRGNKIAELYHRDNYENPDMGDLGNSCMSAKPAWYFGIYTQNHMVCRLVVLKSAKDPSKIVGRALLWKLTKPDITYMDRIYANTPGQMQLFREYARNQGWYHKEHNNNSADGHAIDPKGTKVDLGELRVRIKDLEYTAYPYVDTLKFLSVEDGSAYLSTEDSENTKFLEDTHGNWASEDGCEECGGTGRQGCYECDATGLVDCGKCRATGVVDGAKCERCGGARRTECRYCEGDGYVDCNECQ